MPGIYVFGPPDAARSMLEWLSRNGFPASEEEDGEGVRAIVLAGQRKRPPPPDDRVAGIPLRSLAEIRGRLGDDDVVIVAGPDVDTQVAELFACGLFNVYDGVALRRLTSPVRRFLKMAAHCFVGPNAPETSESARSEFLRYSSAPIEPRDIPGHWLFVVNSMPKAGSVWLIAMLEQLLGVKARERITLSHVRDIETDWPKPNCHGAVVLVRDLRDVVVSWFHHVQRSDLQNGFAAPRYATLDAFYAEYFLGQLYGSDRYYSGDLERWLNRVGALSFPLVRYEDMLRDTAAALRKIMTSWKLDVTDAALRAAARDYTFDRMRATVAGRDGYVAESVESGHLRAGRAGNWESELPAAIARDVDRRFRAYQRRLGYL